MTETTLVKISELTTLPEARYRAGLVGRKAIVADYADDMAGGSPFPAIDVFKVGGTLYVADGWLRVQAAKLNKSKEIEAVVRDGSLHDLIMFARQANSKHGQRRSIRDKWAAVADLLKDPLVENKSHNNIAKLADVSRDLVIKVEREGKLPGPDSVYFTPDAIIESLHSFAWEVGCRPPPTDPPLVEPPWGAGEVYTANRNRWEAAIHVAPVYLGLVDPASNPQGNKVIRASRVIEETENGIAPETNWLDEKGESAKVVWCNPPFSLTDGDGSKNAQLTGCEPFIKKAVQEWQANRVQHVIMLLPIRVTSEWWKDLIGGDRDDDENLTLPQWSLILIDDKNLTFGTENRGPTQIAAPGTKTPLECMLAYLGDREPLFVNTFGEWGDGLPAGSVRRIWEPDRELRPALRPGAGRFVDKQPVKKRSRKLKGTSPGEKTDR